MNSKDTITEAVSLIKTAILQSQARAAAAVNQEQLSLYYGIGRYVSQNTRNKNWGTGAIKSISDKLKAEIPGIRGFGETNLKNMRLFYESWKELDTNHISKSAGLLSNSSVATDDISQIYENEGITIRQSQLTKLPNFPLAEFLSISFTHHVAIFTYAKDFDERIFYIRYAHENKPSAECLEKAIRKQDLYHHQGKIANSFLSTMPDYKQAFQAIQMFKDEYLLDFINVEELGVRDEEVDERVIENAIVHNVKNFIMTFGKGFAFIGNQVHFDKLGHDQLSAYLRILNDDDRRANEKAPIGIILCKDADKSCVEYVMQDFKQPMGVATYKTAEDMDPEVLKVLPPKEELQKLLQSNDKF